MNQAQLRIARILQSGKIPHALLFCGIRGVGKKNAAYQFATTLLKTKKKVDNHPDIYLLFPEGKTDMHPLSAIRKITHDAALAPFEAHLKIFIIHDAEKMLPTSSNALLKTLEEPPPQTVILMLSNCADKILPTLLSRCQIIAFPSGQEKNINQSILAFLCKEMPHEDLVALDNEQPDAVFETLLLWYRDRLLLEIGGCEEFLHFPHYIEHLKQTHFVPLEIIEKSVHQIRLAFERSTKLSTCLEMFFYHLIVNSAQKAL